MNNFESTAARRLPPNPRATLYFLLNAMFSLGVLVVSMTAGAEEPRTLYLCLLMAICSSPLLWVRQLNGRYVLLCAFLAAYLFFYGARDLAALFATRNASLSHGIVSAGEIAVLAGALLVVIGYRSAIALNAPRADPKPARDYPMSLVVIAGIALWVVGTAAVWIWQVRLQINAFSLSKDFSNTAILALTMGRMLQPLATIMLAYALVVSRSRWLLLVIIGMLLIEAVVGFVGDSKETAFRGVIVLLLASFLLNGKVAKGWLAVLLAFAVLVYPVFQAYRAEVIHMRGMTRAQAASDIMGSLKLALSVNDKVKRNYSEEYSAPSFLERTALKPTMELFIAKTGDVAPFQNGYTLGLTFTGLVPRYFWPDKPDTSVGQLMNREFHVSEDPNTYISATHLGEFYWNFGYLGILFGMPAIGFMLGFINARCDLSERRTLTRLLVLITTIYAAVIRFEGSIALEYIVMIRSLAIIWLLHLLFARIPVALASGERKPRPAAAEPLIHAPQLLR